MVSSSVYGNEDLLHQVYQVLDNFGYEVWMSHKGTIPVDSRRTAFQNCLQAVVRCDIFLGIITGRYGSGRAERGLSITHREMRHAVKLGKTRFFAVHANVTLARQLLKQFRHTRNGNRRPASFFQPTPVLDDIRVLDMYEEATLVDLPLEERKGNWVQPFSTSEELLMFISAQFSDPARLRAMIRR